MKNLILVSMILMVACQQIDKYENEQEVSDTFVQENVQQETDYYDSDVTINFNGNGELISIDSLDFEKIPIMQYLVGWLNDTITPTNWKVEYFVKNDTTINRDIYIKISKDGFENLFKGEHLLQYRSYFLPVYLTETNNEIIMTHGCATDCRAITAISKKDSDLIDIYTNVVDFNEERKVLVYLTDSTYINDNEIFEMQAINFVTDEKSILTLENICTGVYKLNCIDTVIYKNNDVEIVTSLRENMSTSESTKKKHLIKLK